MRIVGFYFPASGDVACIDCQPLWPLDALFTPVAEEQADEYGCDTCDRVLDQVTAIQVDGSIPSNVQEE